MKKKISISIFLFLTTLMFSQQLTESKKKYSKVVEVELKKDAIYQKIREWISINYKSSKDVLQLDSKEKIITKGNFVMDFLAVKNIVKYRISTTMIFSIKDSKFKIDLTPTKINAVDYPDMVLSNGLFEMFMTDKLLSENEFSNFSQKMALEQLKLLGYSDKKSKNLLKKSKKLLPEYFKSYKVNHENFKKEIKNTFSSIEKTVNKQEEEW